MNHQLLVITPLEFLQCKNDSDGMVQILRRNIWHPKIAATSRAVASPRKLRAVEARYLFLTHYSHSQEEQNKSTRTAPATGDVGIQLLNCWCLRKKRAEALQSQFSRQPVSNKQHGLDKSQDLRVSPREGALLPWSRWSVSTKNLRCTPHPFASDHPQTSA